MTAELATVQHGSSLALDAEQDYWNDKQLAALRHMGVENASGGDLAVFHHVCQRTGLDPFARQIYMIGRNAYDARTKQWTTKFTIQTGIDGFRLIGRRAANKQRQSISIAAPEWAHEDGTWRPLWIAAWGRPVAARVTIRRDGDPFEAVALFDEYKQTKKDGDLTQMWAQRPAGQIAKCAEALAWRMAFPQDLSGIYADEEMGQASNAEVRIVEQEGASAADRMSAALGTTPKPETVTVEQVTTEPESVEPDAITSAQLKTIGAAMRKLGITARADALLYVNDVIGREVESRNDLTKDEASKVIESLESDMADAPTTEGGAA